MKNSEAAALLTLAAAYDNRKPDADAAKAWAMALDDLGFTACREAVVTHYRDSNEWLMPATIRAIVRRIEADRLRSAPAVEEPAWLAAIQDPDEHSRQYLRWRRERRQTIAGGGVMPVEGPREIVSSDAVPAIAELARSMGASRTGVSPEAEE